MDFRKDESYTPSRVSIRAGNSYGDLKEVRSIELNEPQGWVVVPLVSNQMERGGGADGGERAPLPLRCHMLQLAVIANHQNGRDTHLRQVKIYGPRQDAAVAMGFPLQFTSEEFACRATVR